MQESVSEFNQEMQQSLKRHREEETKNDHRNMTSTEYNKSKAISSLFLNSLKFNLMASVSGRKGDKMSLTSTSEIPLKCFLLV